MPAVGRDEMTKMAEHDGGSIHQYYDDTTLNRRDAIWRRFGQRSGHDWKQEGSVDGQGAAGADRKQDAVTFLAESANRDLGSLRKDILVEQSIWPCSMREVGSALGLYDSGAPGEQSQDAQGLLGDERADYVVLKSHVMPGTPLTACWKSSNLQALLGMEIGSPPQQTGRQMSCPAGKRSNWPVYGQPRRPLRLSNTLRTALAEGTWFRRRGSNLRPRS